MTQELVGTRQWYLKGYDDGERETLAKVKKLIEECQDKTLDYFKNKLDLLYT